jgi:toxin ParE1/3/4
VTGEIRLTLRAMNDLEDARRYTEEIWGEAQWLRYFSAIQSGFDRIAADPMCGQSRGQFLKGMRSLTVGRHLIFFIPVRHAGGVVVVSRIVHQSRNLRALTYREDTGPKPTHS